MFRRRKEEGEREDFSDEFAALLARVRDLEARVEALERTFGQPSTPPPPLPQPPREGIQRGRTRRPYLEEK